MFVTADFFGFDGVVQFFAEDDGLAEDLVLGELAAFEEVVDGGGADVEDGLDFVYGVVLGADGVAFLILVGEFAIGRGLGRGGGCGFGICYGTGLLDGLGDDGLEECLEGIHYHGF